MVTRKGIAKIVNREFTEDEEKIRALIKQRRRQILVHSYIYYGMDTNIISDHKWTEFAMELVKLQNDYPELADTVEFAKEFKDFDGSTGYHLPYRNESIVMAAHQLLINKSL